MRLQISLGLAVCAPAFVACSSDLPAIRQSADGTGFDVKLPSTGEFVACDSPQGARRLVTTPEGKLLYEGQALMNNTCARGQCHNTDAVGDQRLGAPAGLNFDLPLVPLDAQGTPDPNTLMRLEQNQRIVYDWRQRIWTQVDKGRMPPGGRGQPFREDPNLTEVTYDAQGCSKVGAVAPITDPATRDALAVWLACGSPLIESSDASTMALAIPSQDAIGVAAPLCEVKGAVTDASFDNLYSMVIGPSCVPGCHAPGGIRAQTDYSTPQLAYDSLVNAPVIETPGCSGIPQKYAVPGNPEASYVLHKMADPKLQDSTYCGLTMPYGQQPLVAGTALMRAWIEAGCPAPGAAVGGGGSGDAGTSQDGGL